MRILVAQLVEAERALGGDVSRALQRFAVAGIAPGDFVQRAQMTLGVGKESPTGLGQRALLADAGEHVLQIPPLGNVVVHVVGRDQRDTDAGGHGRQLFQMRGVRCAVRQLGGEEEAVAEDLAVGE